MRILSTSSNESGGDIPHRPHYAQAGWWRNTCRESCVACVTCSLKKAARTSVLDDRTGEVVSLFHPRSHEMGGTLRVDCHLASARTHVHGTRNGNGSRHESPCDHFHSRIIGGSRRISNEPVDSRTGRLRACVLNSIKTRFRSLVDYRSSNWRAGYAAAGFGVAAS